MKFGSQEALLQSMNDKLILKRLTKIRADNNKLWMGLVAIAIKTKEGRALMRRIIKNDQKISKWMSRF